MREIESFSTAMKKLYFAISTETPYSKNLMKYIFQRSDDLIHSDGVNKLFNITFLGRYLMNTAENLRLLNDIESFMTVEYPNKEGKTELITFTMRKC